jgi:hypothetical protein
MQIKFKIEFSAFVLLLFFIIIKKKSKKFVSLEITGSVVVIVMSFCFNKNGQFNKVEIKQKHF